MNTRIVFLPLPARAAPIRKLNIRFCQFSESCALAAISLSVILCLLAPPARALELHGYANPYKQAKESIVFIYSKNAEATNPTALALGTGFLMHLKVENPPEKGKDTIVFLITNKHVIDGQDDLILRLGGAEGAPSYTTIHLDRSPGSGNVKTSKKAEVDLAAISIGLPEKTKPVAFAYDTLVDEESLQQIDVSEGTDVFTAGYLRGYSGATTNLPLVRTGKVAMMTGEHWLRLPGAAPPAQAYICELGITGGASGSPVLLAPEQVRVCPDNTLQMRNIGPRILGVIKAYPTLPFQHTVDAPVQDILGGVPTIKVVPVPVVTMSSMGLALVEPAQNLKDLLDDIVLDLKSRNIKVILPTSLDSPSK